MKKRLMGITLALSVLMLIVSPIMPQKTAYAFQTLTISNGEYIWYEVENNEATFCGYINYNKTVTEYEIPSEIKGYPVTAVKVIDSYEFEVKKLVIPDTVKTIKNNGFAYCTSLEEVEMGANVEVIENIAFSDCTSLEKITLSPKLKTIGENAFVNCTSLKEIVIPDSVTSIGQFAFNQCTSLEKVTIGSGLKELPLAAFDSCSSLHTVSMGKNIEIIGEQAFMYCTALKNITIPSKVTAIEKSAFTYCEALEEVAMPNSLLTIGRDAFANCSGLKKVTLGKNVKTIDMCAFEECSSLESIVIPDSVETLGISAFGFCRALKSAVLSKNIPSIEERVFNECSSLESISIPDSVETIGESAFGYCTSLKSVSIGRGVDTIGENAFSNCSALENISMQYGVREIGRSAFMSTGPIAKLVIPDSVTTLGEYAFMYSNIQNIVLGKGQQSIERGTFYLCNSLRSVTIPDNIEYIGQNAFADNESLAKVVIGEGVSKIDEYAFNQCRSLKTVEIGSGEIGYCAFSCCYALESVTLSESVEAIGDNSFSNCEALKEITIPGSVRGIDDYAFSGCKSLTKAEIGAGVTEIGDYAFNYCSALKEITIPASVETMGGSILYGTEVKDVYYGGAEAQWYTLMETNWLGTNDATIHFGMKSANVSTTTTKSIYSNRRHHIVYKNLNGMEDVNDDYVICTDAVISFDGQTYPADENGIVPMPKTSDITVSAPGYRTEVLEYSDYMNGLGIFLEKETDLPIIKSVELGKDEVRRSSEKFTKNREAQFWADVDTNGHTGCEIYIENGENKWTINGSNGGYSTTINIGEEYNSWNDSYIVVEMADGRKISKKINIGYVPAAKEKPVVSFGDSITGIGNNEFPYLNQMKFDFSIPNFPFDFTIEDDKIVATFGVDISKWKYSKYGKEKGEWDNQYNAHKTLAEVIKNSHERMEEEESIVEEYNKLVKEIGGVKTGGKAKLGFDANISAVGYLEGTIDAKGIFFSDGGVIFTAEGEVGPEGQGIIVIGPAPVPYNWEVKFKGKIESELQVAQREARSEELTPQGTLGGSVGIKAGIGPGLSDVHINACIEGSFDPKYTFTYNSSDFKLEASMGVYLEAVLGPWKHKFGPKPIKAQLYPKEKAAASELGSFSVYDIDEFTVIDRDYLDTPQEFTANNNVKIFEDTTVDETVIKTNTFPVADPKMVDLGSGKRIVVWVDEDMTADEYNGRTIKYSYYDGSVWTEEAYVEQDGMSDFNPQLKTVGGRAYLVWESVDTVMSAASDVNDMYANMEIKYAVFDEATGKFTGAAKLTDNACTDRNPVINDVNGSAVITWVNNSESDVFTANSNSSLCYAVVDGEAVVKTETAKSGLNHIESHIAQGSADSVEILYIADTDSSLENTADNELFSTNYGQLTDDDNVKSALQIVSGVIYLYNGGKLVTYSGDMSDTGIALLNDRFIITESDKTVVYLEGSGAASDVYAYFYDKTEKGYGKPIKLTDTGMCLEDISGYTNESGQLVLAFGRRHITGDLESDGDTLYGASDVVCITVTPTYDIALDYAFADANNMMPGFDTVIEADVTNCGSETINSVTVTLYDEDGNVIASDDDNITLLAGESGTAELVYTVPADFTGFNGRVSVSVADEYNTDNNSYDVSLMCRDVEIRAVSCSPNMNGAYNIYAELANNSFEAENDVKVCLTKDDVTVAEKTVETVGSLESVVVTFEGISDAGTYKLVAPELENETMIGNNDEYVVIAAEDDGFAYEIDNVSLKKSDTAISICADVLADTAVTETASLIVALYDRQGMLVSLKMIPVIFDNETVKSIDDSMELCDFESARLMLWNSSNKPLAAIIE